MADHNTPIPVLLKGGPCNGQKVTGERGPDFPLDYTCKGVTYQYTGKNLKDGRYVYAPYHPSQPPGPPGPAPGATPGRAHTAWNRMLRTVFVDSPKELRRAAEAREAMRRLRHRPGLK